MSVCLRAWELQEHDRRQALADGLMAEGRGGRLCEEPDNLLCLSHGSWKEFTHLWARHRLQECLSAGSELLYGMTLLDRSFFSTEGFDISALTFSIGFRQTAHVNSHHSFAHSQAISQGHLHCCSHFKTRSRLAYLCGASSFFGAEGDIASATDLDAEQVMLFIPS